MPNSGMLDHVTYRPFESAMRGTKVNWLDPWPSKVGYQTPRTFKISDFSRHMIKQTKKELHLQRSLSRPSSSVGVGNSVAPFHTAMKPTCGYYFSREMDHRKKCIGIPPTNLVAWRSVRSPYARTITTA